MWKDIIKKVLLIIANAEDNALIFNLLIYIFAANLDNSDPSLGAYARTNSLSGSSSCDSPTL